MARKSCVGREFSTRGAPRPARSRRPAPRGHLAFERLDARLAASAVAHEPAAASSAPSLAPRSATGRSHSYSAWQSAAAELQVLRREFDGPATANERTSAALAFLYQAWEYARQLDRDPNDFAVEMGVLESFGLSDNDCRRLIAGTCVREAPSHWPEEVRHTLHPAGQPSVSRPRRFVLTDVGARYARATAPRSGAFVDRAWPAHGRPAVAAPRGRDLPPLPQWDGRLRELHFGGRLVKCFRVPSPNQETILAAFQEEGWPELIDDPLPPAPCRDPKRRVHDTIKNLNRHQANCLLRFYGDGTGKGIRWAFRAHEAARR